MDLREIAEALVAGCRAGQDTANIDRFYAEDAVSVEAESYDGAPRETRGRDGIRGKHAWWEENFEAHGVEVTGPFLHAPDRFTVIFAMDVTHRPSGERTQMQEVALYTVAGGRIVREEFFAPVR